MLKDAQRGVNVASISQLYLGKVGKCGGFGIECRNGLDKPRHRQRIAHAPRTTHEPQRTAFASQLDRNAHQRRDAGAIDLRNSIEINDDLANARFGNSLKSIVQLLAGLSNCQPASHFEYGDTPGLSNSDFHGRMLGHGTWLENLILAAALSPLSPSYRNAGFTTAMHYTMAAPCGKNALEKNSRGEVWVENGHRRRHPSRFQLTAQRI
jgi:hypothetical protein